MTHLEDADRNMNSAFLFIIPWRRHVIAEYRYEHVWIWLRSFRSIVSDKEHKDQFLSDLLIKHSEKSCSRKYV